jgi:FAD-dependent urate hydroxylase
VRVLIVGAGIAGLALAGGLQRRGHDVTVVEEAEQLRTGGAAISVWNNGAMALRRLGTELEGHGQVIERLEFRSPRGNLVGWVDTARLNRQFGIDAVTIPRGELLEHLASALTPGTIRFGAGCRHAHDSGDGAVVELTDGEVFEADLVAGADGQRSVVRNLFAPVVPARPSGWASLQGLTKAPLEMTSGSTSIYATGPPGGVGMMPAGRGQLQWWFDVRWPPPAMPTSLAAWLRQEFARWKPPMSDLLDVIDDGDIEPFPHAWHRVPPHLHRDHVVLIGDAVHAIPPVLAQGANQSIEDAWIVARELESSSSIPVALARYEKERRRKVVAVSRMARMPMLPLYGAVNRVPLRASFPERLCRWSWGSLIRSSSSTLGRQ